MQLCPGNANMMINDISHSKKQTDELFQETDSHCVHQFRNMNYIKDSSIFFISVDGQICRYIHTHIYTHVKIVRILKKHYVALCI